jgi:hypothetical protein
MSMAAARVTHLEYGVKDFMRQINVKQKDHRDFRNGLF